MSLHMLHRPRLDPETLGLLWPLLGATACILAVVALMYALTGVMAVPTP